MRAHQTLYTLASLLIAGGVAYALHASSADALSLLEPASGAAAVSDTTEGDHSSGPKKAHNGKVVSAEGELPVVKIGREVIITHNEQQAKFAQADLPETLKSPMDQDLLMRRLSFVPFAHNPVTGTLNASVTLVEMTDLSCIQCMPALQGNDKAMTDHPQALKLINIHMPVQAYNDTNLPAFYGKVAQRAGTFWAYRNALLDLKSPTPEAYFDTLVASGIDRVTARRLLATESRRFYRELDADAQLSHGLVLKDPPYVFVNGIKVGDGGVDLKKLADTVVYELRYVERQRMLEIP